MSITGVFGSSAASSPITVCGYGAGSQGSVLTTKSTSGWWNQANACVIPAGAVGTGGYVEVKYEISTSFTAGTTQAGTFFATMRGVTIGAVLSISAAGSYRGNMRIRNVDGVNQLVTTSNGDGSTGANLFNFSCDMSIDQTITFWVQPGAAGTNTLNLKGWSVEAHKATATATPAALVPGMKMFYGMNHHFDYGNTPPRSDVISAMHVLGMNTLRVSWFSPTNSIGGVTGTTWIQDMASAFQLTSPKLSMMVMCGVGPYSASGAVWASEAKAYSAGFAQGSAAAFLLGPKGVVLYEMGNEIDADGAIRRTPVGQGTAAADFSFTSGSAWCQWRGNMRGFYDGVKSVQPTAQVGSNGFVDASIWASDALWNGMAPLGTLDNVTSGNPQVRWDWTNWHLYTEGDATDVFYTSNLQRFNMLKYLHNAYGKPIVISEFHASDATSASNVAITTAWLTTWYNHQADYNIAGVVWYDWFDSPYQYCNSVASPSVPNSVGAAMTAFIAAHPALK